MVVYLGVLVAVSAAVWRFLPLFEPLRKISDRRVGYYTQVLLPLGLKHAAAAAALWLLDRRRVRGLLVFGIVTSTLVIRAGGLPAIGTLAALAALAYGMIGAGSGIGGRVLRASDRRWPIELALGILAVSFLSAVLGVAGLFFAPLLGLPLLAAAVLHAHRRGLGGVRRSVGRALQRKWSFAEVMAAESAWLLGAFVWVAASAPESRSDALRAYLPFVKILAHFHRMPTTPVPWAFAIPEGAPAFSASFLAIAGTRAMRYAMPLCLLALVGTVAMAGAGRRGRAVALAMAVAVASTPVVLATTPTLMHEAFVSLAIVVAAWLAFRARAPLDARFGLLFGAVCGAAVAAKFTTLPYLGLLAVVAGARVARSGIRRFVTTAASAAAGAIGVYLPWMVRGWRIVGNPFFPFLTRVVPTRVYPHGLGSMNLDLFRLQGWTAWLRAPLEFTYRTSAYLEGANGGLGLTVLFGFAVAMFLLFARVPLSARLLAGVALAGATALWTKTAYARYWLPTLWLIAIASAWGFSRRRRPPAFAAASAVVLLGGLVFLHVPVMAAQQWNQPDGFPWSHYTGSTGEAEYLRRLTGYAAIAEFTRRAPPWPVILETGVAGCAHVDASCLELDFWHLSSLMDIHSLDGALALVRSTGAQYWAIDERAGAIPFFRKLGVASRLWRPDNLVVDSPPFRVYRLAPAGDAARDPSGSAGLSLPREHSAASDDARRPPRAVRLRIESGHG